MTVAGDIVRYDAREWIVVDVTADNIAVLRGEDDPELLEPLAVLADVPQVVRHADHFDGWVEDSPGIWSTA